MGRLTAGKKINRALKTKGPEYAKKLRSRLAKENRERLQQSMVAKRNVAIASEAKNPIKTAAVVEDLDNITGFPKELRDRYLRDVLFRQQVFNYHRQGSNFTIRDYAKCARGSGRDEQGEEVFTFLFLLAQDPELNVSDAFLPTRFFGYCARVLCKVDPECRSLFKEWFDANEEARHNPAKWSKRLELAKFFYHVPEYLDTVMQYKASSRMLGRFAVFAKTTYEINNRITASGVESLTDKEMSRFNEAQAALLNMMRVKCRLTRELPHQPEDGTAPTDIAGISFAKMADTVADQQHFLDDPMDYLPDSYTGDSAGVDDEGGAAETMADFRLHEEEEEEQAKEAVPGGWQFVCNPDLEAEDVLANIDKPMPNAAAELPDMSATSDMYNALAEMQGPPSAKTEATHEQRVRKPTEVNGNSKKVTMEEANEILAKFLAHSHTRAKVAKDRKNTKAMAASIFEAVDLLGGKVSKGFDLSENMWGELDDE